ncbi:MAG: aminoacetone oxidase family FAD-binding enzyme [Lachnospiraceae bacterium]|nr:aminoacetone oxidase family FAD-binding enzyme [Lachnospiraceae bacterium]
MKKRSIAVIGAGAAGMMAAVTAARAGAAVTIYEHRSEAGRKLLMTGNGKCNLTNTRMGMSYYYCDSEDGKQIVRTVLAQFDEVRSLSFFHEIGLLTYDRDGYVYPQSEQAVTVRDVLLRECLFCGVNFRYDTDVYPLLRREETTGRFVIGKERYDRLILACGGKSERQTGSDGSGYELAKRFGHRILTPLPALVSLYTDEPDWQSMAGVRAKARVRLFVEGRTAGEADGELQMTAQGISGIPVLELSRIAVHAIHEGKRVEAEICFLNGRERVQIEALLQRMLARGHAEEWESPSDMLQTRLTGTVNSKILSFILRRICNDMERLHNGRPDEDRLAAAVAQQLFSCRIPINGHGKLEHAQVTSGGVLFDEVTEKLESRLCEGLFFAGEMLDVDGICGGYNLQWAWSSGYAAGLCAAEK